MSGAVPLAPCIFMAWPGAFLPLPNEILFIIRTYCCRRLATGRFRAERKQQG